MFFYGQACTTHISNMRSLTIGGTAENTIMFLSTNSWQRSSKQSGTDILSSFGEMFLNRELMDMRALSRWCRHSTSPPSSSTKARDSSGLATEPPQTIMGSMSSEYCQKNGKDWYLIKDSGSGSRNNSHPGYFFFSEDYVKLKMLGFGVHKSAVTSLLKKAK